MIELKYPPVADPGQIAQTVVPKIAVVGGQWGQNVGNAFFNLGGKHVLEQVFGTGAVGFHQDQPTYRTLHNKFKGNPAHYADLIRELDISHLVLQGPVLNGWLGPAWSETFAALKETNVKIIFHSAAFFKFSDKELAHVRAFLSEYPPHLICTRDSRTYDILDSWYLSTPLLDGIDAGFYLPDCVAPLQMRKERSYITLNFDRYPEPALQPHEDASLDPNGPRIDLLGHRIALETPRRLMNLSHKSKIAAYLGDLTDKRQLSETWQSYRILRPDHRFYPHVTHKIYRRPGAFVSDEPWSYASVYAGTAATLSDRVHACVATLAYGNPAMLFTPSPRSALFERLGLSEIKKRPVMLCQDRLIEAKASQISWLKAHV